uniref:Uncharacterized protein n=1 Tax=Chromera velia CCMP2878 TaxID=1169474 RepID=A0A0G4HGW1_9ALVE|eukprot:Cvel_27374.t1-p1 / transcript=Cvel_27374.t1 / gene=Cvel_27374 / organism=Chromera_velia_CCMP2878 / gene_product=hypothetical protein / transcript_product=hypothetical protein / location=Cvel_scaffold3405:36-299(-) / protein_length=88 / sequence_SO=supercontig / SO=protein_coding / is_pseudo=false
MVDRVGGGSPEDLVGNVGGLRRIWWATLGVHGGSGASATGGGLEKIWCMGNFGGAREDLAGSVWGSAEDLVRGHRGGPKSTEIGSGRS